MVTAGGGAGVLEVALAATEVVDWGAEVVVVTGALLVSLQPARSNSAAAAIAVRYLILNLPGVSGRIVGDLGGTWVVTADGTNRFAWTGGLVSRP